MDRPDPATARAPRWRTPLVGGLVVSAVLLGGGVALADGGGSTGTASAPSAPGTDHPQAPGGQPGTPGTAGTTDPPGKGDRPHRAGGRQEPAGDRTVGRVTAVSDGALTVTDDLGTTHRFTVSATTRIHDGKAPARPPAAAPSGSSTTPTEPTPTKPTPTKPTPTEPAPGQGTGSLSVGQRVEVRSTDSAATEVRVVLARVDGLVTAVHGTTLTVTTNPGLHVQVDAHALSPVPAVGARVHLQGTVSADGDTVVATR